MKSEDKKVRAFPDPMRGAEQTVVNQTPHKLEEGMDLRDYFAAKAMQGMVQSFYSDSKTKDSPQKLLERMELISKNSYWFADKMIEQREQI